MFPSFVQVSSATRLRRSRLLPVSGLIMVRTGQKVNPEDVIAEATLPSRHVFFDIPKSFGMSNLKKVEPMIKRKIGEMLEKNDILAETGGMMSKVIRMTQPGKIISIRDGQVLVETETTTISLKAVYPGTVVEMIADRGVVIETSGAILQGAWGNGKSGFGTVLNKAETKTSEFLFSSLDMAARGMIIVCGTCLKPDVLSQAAALPIAGLILGSLPAAAREKALNQPYPIISLNGFSTAGMDDLSFRILGNLKDQYAVINAEMGDDFIDIKPEALFTAPVENPSAVAPSRYTAGQMIRIHTAPFLGQVGTIEKILPGFTVLSNGLRVSAASIIMENREKKTIPVADFDVIGFGQNTSQAE